MFIYRLISFLGIFGIIGIAFLFSNNKRKVNWQTVFWGITLQIIFALLILKTRPGIVFFDYLRIAVNKLLSFTDIGASFLFGNLYNGTADIAKTIGQSGPLQLFNSQTGKFVDLGIVFAIHILPTIIFFSAFMSILYHLGVMQRVVEYLAKIMTKFMKTSGAESLSAASNIFVGQTEAPLVVKPFVKTMTMSELMAVMTGGFATIAGGVLAAYVKFGVDAGHLMAASVMSAPAALVMAKIFFPETEKPLTMGVVKINTEKTTSNVIDAAAAGAKDGLGLALNVGGMLIAFIAIIAMINYLLGLTDDILNLITFYQFHFNFDLNLTKIFSIIFTPFAFLMGTPFHDIPNVATLLGTKVTINELVAYVDLVSLKNTLSPRAFTIATYALCGFANFSSIAIQIGGLSGIAPTRRSDLAKLGLRAMFAGALASWLTATIAGLLL